MVTSPLNPNELNASKWDALMSLICQLDSVKDLRERKVYINPLGGELSNEPCTHISFPTVWGVNMGVYVRVYMSLSVSSSAYASARVRACVREFLLATLVGSL